jgi:hypothetical protein
VSFSEMVMLRANVPQKEEEEPTLAMITMR